MAIFDKEGTEIVESSGNVFLDLKVELTPEEAFKVDLAREFTRIVNARNYSQKDIAKIIGTDQAKVSNILRGKMKDFSIERLVRYLSLIHI